MSIVAYHPKVMLVVHVLIWNGGLSGGEGSLPVTTCRTADRLLHPTLLRTLYASQ